jgi:SMC interacting uncharacterized protein involved in chromosome segregation
MNKDLAHDNAMRIKRQAKALEDYCQRILTLQANVNSRDATIAALQAENRELRAALAITAINVHNLNKHKMSFEECTHPFCTGKRRLLAADAV